MSEQPIMATVVETPTPMRPRLYVTVAREPFERQRYPTSCAHEIAELAISRGWSDGILFALPGSEEAWTEAKVRAAAVKYIANGRWAVSKETLDCMVEFARVLGVLSPVVSA